jgi:hypothetical protein
MASLRLGLVMGGRVWLSELSDPMSYRRSSRLSGSGLDRVVGLGSVLAKSGRGRTRKGGGPPAALGLWDELPSGLRYPVLGYPVLGYPGYSGIQRTRLIFDAVARWFVIVS